MVIALSELEVADLLKMNDCIEVLEQAYKDIALGTAINTPRRDTFLAVPRPDTYFSFKTHEGGLERLGVMVQRINSDLITYPKIHGEHRRVKLPVAGGSQNEGLCFLYSLETTELIALLPDAHISRMRVAGTTGVGAKCLSCPDAHRLALYGSGWQAEAAAWAVCAVRSIASIRVYSPTAEHRVAFARRLEETVGVEVTPVESAEKCSEGADIVATATNTDATVFRGGLACEGMHLTCITPGELDEEAWRRSDVIVASSLPANYEVYRTESERLRSIRADEQKRTIELERLERYAGKTCTLPELLTGKGRGRTSPTQITLMNKSTGLAIEFAAVGKLAYDLAKAQGVGRELPIDLFLKVHSPGQWLPAEWLSRKIRPLR